jgi:NADH-quinone oxidoreductase subunit F
MADTLTPVLSERWDADRSWTLATYEAHGGYEGLRLAKEKGWTAPRKEDAE